jgi:hypothetical protein
VLLLARSVPDRKLIGLCFDSCAGVRVLNGDGLIKAGCVDSAELVVVEATFRKPNRQRSLADSR